jgi:CRISPR-associated protein Csx17
MTDTPPPPPAGIDWSLTTFEGARREQLRRWAELPLRNIILALEEMEELAERLGGRPDGSRPDGLA